MGKSKIKPFGPSITTPCSNDVWRGRYNVLFVMIGENSIENQWTEIKKLLDVIIGQLYFLRSDLLDEKGELLEPIKKLLEPNQSEYAEKGRKHFEYTQTDRTDRQLYPKVEFHIREEDPDKNIFNKIVFIFENGTIPENCKKWLMNHNSLIKGSNSNNNLLPKIEIVKEVRGNMREMKENGQNFTEMGVISDWTWPAKPGPAERDNWKSNNYFICGDGKMINSNLDSMIKALQYQRWNTRKKFNPLARVIYNIYVLEQYLSNQDELNKYTIKYKLLKYKNIEKLHDENMEDKKKIKESDFMAKWDKIQQEYEQEYEKRQAIDKALQEKQEQERKAAEEAAAAAAAAATEQERKAAAEAAEAASLKRKKLIELENKLQSVYDKIYNELKDEQESSEVQIAPTDIINRFFLKLYTKEKEKNEKYPKDIMLGSGKDYWNRTYARPKKIYSFYANPMFFSEKEIEKIVSATQHEMSNEQSLGQCKYITYKKFEDAASQLKLLEGQENRYLFEEIQNLVDHVNGPTKKT